MTILEKIKKDIMERSVVKNLAPFPQTGKSHQEFDYRYCTSDTAGLDDYYFVVSKIMNYLANSLVDYGYVVYAYDKEGNFVEDPAIMDKCKGKFFDTLKDAE